MKSIRFAAVFVLWTGITIMAASCEAAEAEQSQEMPHLRVDVQPLEQPLKFAVEKKQISKRQVRGEYPGYEVVILFEKPIYNKWALTDRLMKVEPVTEDDRKRLGNYADWDRRVNLRQDKTITIFAVDQEDAKRLTLLVMQHLDAMMAGQIESAQDRLAVLEKRKDVFDAYFKELIKSKSGCLSSGQFNNIRGMSVEDAKDTRLELQRELLAMEVERAALEEKARQLHRKQGSGRTDEQRDRYGEMKVEAEAELGAIESSIDTIKQKLRTLNQYIAQKEKAEIYQEDIEALERVMDRNHSSVESYRRRLAPEGELKMPKIIDDTITIYTVEVVE
ncbi:MAG: hypothetical protein ACYSUT_08545 [Planctomycetota bacterium]|jgi:hypothetical protein